MKKKKNVPQKEAEKSERKIDQPLEDIFIRLAGNFLFPWRNERREALACAILLSAATLLFLLPFIGKAYHIDDPMYIWVAKHIHLSPLDPYGFTVNWYGLEEPLWSVMKNPPLVSYYLAVAALVLGWSEIAMHLALMIPAVAVILGVYYVARRLCRQPVHAAVACLCTPVFIVSGTTVMSDILMLAFWTWSVGLWLRGLDDSRPGLLASSSLLMALAALTKYYGMALIPLLLVYSLVRKRSLGRWAFYFLIPIAMLAAYQEYTRLLYGSGLLTEAARFPGMSVSEHYTDFIRMLTGLAFLGGCTAAALFYAPFVWPRKTLLIGGLLLLVTAVIFSASGAIGDFPLRDSDGIRFSVAFQFSLFLIAGIGILALAATDVREHRDAASVLILLWIGGTVVFASLVNWTVNGRAILPMVPAVAVLIMRRIESRAKQPSPARLHPSWALIPAAALALLVGYADFTSADSGRAAVAEIEKRHGRQMSSVWFQGHWGFQYYMELLGARPVDPKRTRHATGDLVVIPGNTTHTIPINPRFFVLQAEFEVRTLRYLATMNDVPGAGFYSNVKGPLPYAFGLVRPERYQIWSLTGAR